MNKTKQHAELEFEAELNKLILDLRDRATSQFKYNLETNVPNKIGGITFETAAMHALEQGLVGASNAMTGWGCKEAILRAYAVMEDANVHDVCKVLVPFIPEYQ